MFPREFRAAPSVLKSSLHVTIANLLAELFNVFSGCFKLRILRTLSEIQSIPLASSLFFGRLELNPNLLM